MDKASERLKTQSDQLCAIGGLSAMTLICSDDSARDIRAAKPDMVIYIDNSLDDIADLRAAIADHMLDIRYVAAADITGTTPLIGALEFLIGEQADA
jgi:hypothetical protein